jgi:hypothetical protein
MVAETAQTDGLHRADVCDECGVAESLPAFGLAGVATRVLYAPASKRRFRLRATSLTGSE